MEIVFDFDRWTLLDYQAFINLQKEPDEELETELLVKAISRWSIDKPVTVDTFDELEFALFSKFMELMNHQLQEMLEDETTLDKSINVDGWKMKDFKKYRRALRTGDYKTVLSMFAELGIECPADPSKVGVDQFFTWAKSISKSIDASQKK